ncbi:hypothetical protein HYPSUDRAFT_813679 [Hypholoma sublateritium FD-334 SS-4]|uniref:Uncharacterized protein n=1 Tax=Hypholoma sublateritium (strain FD-334 SS-4) TaxID=945553 RepID=A0A0D2PKE8_HYPSF|nr:hypothetical protein HYPSUDRAFT_813679 [Hypholoma sublateritium FD-334 SS-4]
MHVIGVIAHRRRDVLLGCIVLNRNRLSAAFSGRGSSQLGCGRITARAFNGYLRGHFLSVQLSRPVSTIASRPPATPHLRRRARSLLPQRRLPREIERHTLRLRPDSRLKCRVSGWGALCNAVAAFVGSTAEPWKNYIATSPARLFGINGQ